MLALWSGSCIGARGALGADAPIARLDLPEQLIRGSVMEAKATVEHATCAITTVDLPEVPGLTWDERGIRRSEISINGDSTVSLDFRVLANEEGTYAIPQATIRLADGTTLTTPARSIVVGHGDAKLVGDAWCEASFSPASIVTGETTELRYRIYLRGGSHIQSTSVTPPPNAIVLSSPESFVKSRAYDVHGDEWGSYTAVWQLTWSKPGSYEVGGQQVYLRQSANGFGRAVALSTAIKPGRITVLAPPEEGRPGDFTGLIGPITVAASLQRPRIAVGEGTMLEVVLTGRHVELAPAPKLALPQSVKAYTKDGAARAGSRVFRWDLVPNAVGEHAIPPIGVPYFDLASRTYLRASSTPLALTVLPGRSDRLTISGAPETRAPIPADPEPAAAVLPLRTGAAAVPAPTVAGVALACGLAAGAAAALARRLRLIRPREAHRGQALTAAVAADDLDAVARALERLRPALRDAAQLEAAAQLQAAVDSARFGGERLSSNIAGLARALEQIA